MDDIDRKLERIHRAYEKVRYLDLTRNDLSKKVAEMLRYGEYTLERVTDAHEVYELGSARTSIEYAPARYVLRTWAGCQTLEEVEFTEDYVGTREFQELWREHHGGEVKRRNWMVRDA